MLRRSPLASREVAGRLAAVVRREAPDATHIQVGPILYQNDRLSVLVGAGCPSGSCRTIGLDMSMWPVEKTADLVVPAFALKLWTLQRRGRIQQRQDDALRWAFVMELERSFPHVLTYDDDLALANGYLQVFKRPVSRPAWGAY